MIYIYNFTNILYFNIFLKLRLSTNNLTSLTSSRMEFTNDSILPLETINLHVTFRGKLCYKIILFKFIVIDIPSTYNVIIGRPTLSKLRAVVSTYHMTVKFIMRANIGELKSKPRESYKCYLIVISLLKKTQPETPPMDPRDLSRSTLYLEPIELLIKVSIDKA